MHIFNCYQVIRFTVRCVAAFGSGCLAVYCSPFKSAARSAASAARTKSAASATHRERRKPGCVSVFVLQDLAQAAQDRRCSGGGREAVALKAPRVRGASDGRARPLVSRRGRLGTLRLHRLLITCKISFVRFPRYFFTK